MSQSSSSPWAPLHGLVFLALFIGASFLAAFRQWPLLWLLPLATYAILVFLTPPLRASFRPWRLGRATPATLGATAIIGFGAAAVLLLFHHLARPNVETLSRFLPVQALGSVLAAAIVFPLLNALCEEIVFRGIFFDAIESLWGRWIAVFATAVLFGYGHLHGYPPGPAGAVLAGIFGVCLGWLRLFSGGLGLPVLAHIVADATIFAIVAHEKGWSM